jgi:hypothetical protein
MRDVLRRVCVCVLLGFWGYLAGGVFFASSFAPP